MPAAHYYWSKLTSLHDKAKIASVSEFDNLFQELLSILDFIPKAEKDQKIWEWKVMQLIAEAVFESKKSNPLRFDYTFSSTQICQLYDWMVSQETKYGRADEDTYKMIFAETGIAKAIHVVDTRDGEEIDISEYEKW
jgi:hypothetical protein